MENIRIQTSIFKYPYYRFASSYKLGDRRAETQCRKTVVRRVTESQLFDVFGIGKRRSPEIEMSELSFGDEYPQ